MSERRTLGDALSPEQESFLNTGQASHAEQKKTVPKEVSPKALNSIVPQAISALPTEGGLAALNVRVSPIITGKLLHASLKRKSLRKIPFSQRDIVSEALEMWFAHNGY